MNPGDIDLIALDSYPDKVEIPAKFVEYSPYPEDNNNVAKFEFSNGKMAWCFWDDERHWLLDYDEYQQIFPSTAVKK